jgi:methylglutaconyl-CoA hydratase
MCGGSRGRKERARIRKALGSTAVTALRTEHDGPLLRIAMARPERRNAFDAALIDELAAAFADVGDARAVVLSGDGPSFSAGADVEWMRSSVELSYDENVADALRLRAMLDAIDGCPAPVVARVQGHALGGGCGLVACCDVVVAEPGVQFAFSEVRLGIVPAVISPFALAKIGPGAARRYFVTGERFGADVALRIGLVHEVADDLDTVVDRVVAEILAAGPSAARTAKQLARRVHSAEETAQLIAQHRTSDEGQDGLRAFLEKREPSWRRNGV